MHDQARLTNRPGAAVRGIRRAAATAGLALIASALPATETPGPAEPAVAVREIDRTGYASLVAARRGRALVVNMWATWCEPCREEFPELVRLHREMGPRGVDVAVISLDVREALESAVIPFLASQGVAFPAFLKTKGDDEAFINAVDPKWSGALPATFVYDVEGRLARSITGPTTFAQLTEVVSPLAPPGP